MQIIDGASAGRRQGLRDSLPALLGSLAVPTMIGRGGLRRRPNFLSVQHRKLIFCAPPALTDVSEEDKCGKALQIMQQIGGDVNTRSSSVKEWMSLDSRTFIGAESVGKLPQCRFCLTPV